MANKLGSITVSYDQRNEGSEHGTNTLHESSAQSATASENDIKDINGGPKRSTRLRRAWQNVQYYIWDDPNKPKAEKGFLLKLDFFLLLYTCLGYFCKNLDQTNINNAYVSGMKEALHMGGSELTYASSVFTAGYVISQLPAVILVSRLPPSLIIPTLEILWSVFTFCTAAIKTPQQLYAIRFLVGLAEGAYFPVIVYLISSWYTKHERAKRVTIFYSTASLSGMFSGYLQAAAYRNLNGTNGLEGWQWLYIICGVISLPVGIMGFFFLPDFPETTRAWYLTNEEIEIARRRLLVNGYSPLGSSAWNSKKVRRIVTSWQLYVLAAGYFFVQSGFPIQQPAFALWLKQTGHSVYERNVWPTGQYAIGFVTQIVAGMISDSPLLSGRRWEAITVMQGITMFACIVLAVWQVPVGLKYAAYYLSFTAAGVPGLYYAWFPDLMPHDHEMRGVVTAFANCFSYCNQIWFQLTFWRTIFAPRFRIGFIAASVFGGVLILTTIVLHKLERRGDAKLKESQVDVAERFLSVPNVEATEAGLPIPTSG